MSIDDLLQDLLQLLLSYMEVYFQLQEVLGITSVYKSQILRQNLIEDETSQCRLYRSGDRLTCCIYLAHADMNAGMQCQRLVLICQNCFVYALEILTFADRTGSLLGQIVDTKYHILGRNGYGSTIGRLQ